MTRMPNPTPERTVAAETAAWPRRVSTWFSAWVRSGAVSTSVPSRSKTMVAPFSIGVLSHAPCGHASGGVESAGGWTDFSTVLGRTLLKTEDLKESAARAALDLVEDGMELGLGTGSTAARFVKAVGERVAQGLHVLCVPTSEITRVQAEGLGIPLTTLDETPRLDLAVD